MASAEQCLWQALSKYKYADMVRRDVTNAISQFKDLRPSQSSVIFNDGNRKELLNLDGTIPVTYKGSIYNIPICVWLMDTHPYSHPMVFVKPANTMQIKTGRNVDSNGKVDLPYLRDWRYPQSDLLALLQILVIVFGENPPVFSKQSQMAQSLTPYPGIYPRPLSLPRYTYTESFTCPVSSPRYTYTEYFPYPVSSSQYAYSEPSPYVGASPRYTNSESKAPVSTQEHNFGIFRQTMEKFALGEFVSTLVEHGVDCVETFCSMTESDFEKIGLNIEQRSKCILATQQIKNEGSKELESGIM